MGFVGITINEMNGKEISIVVKILLFGIYCFFKIIRTIIYMVLCRNFIIADLIYDFGYIITIWIATFKISKWINKQ